MFLHIVQLCHQNNCISESARVCVYCKIKISIVFQYLPLDVLLNVSAARGNVLSFISSGQFLIACVDMLSCNHQVESDLQDYFSLHT